MTFTPPRNWTSYVNKHSRRNQATMTTTETMTKNALEIIANRPYTQPGETVDQMWTRIADHVAGAEELLKQDLWRGKFYDLMSSLKFIPNTPTVAYAGIPGDQHCMSACFVDSPDDSLADIVRVGTETPFIESSGGGIGWGLSKLRPANDKVGHKTGGACGPVRVLHWYSSGGMIFTQGIIRQGAHMAQLHVSHPDVLDFIRCKAECLTPSDPLANVNISVQLTDEFMEAVKAGGDWSLVNPRTGLTEGYWDAWDLWEAICLEAWRTGDPGVVFMDRILETAPNSSTLPTIQSSNPCGEEFLEDGGSCNLGSMNLTEYVTKEDLGPGRPIGTWEVDWTSLATDIHTAVRFLDDVIEVNVFPFEHLAEMNRNTRRIGLGVMGWADMLVMLGLRYDSQEALDLATKLSGFITETAWKASYSLGQEKGAYPLAKGVAGVGARRNSSVTTIAPTGSISIIAGVSSGIEPHFDLMWERKAIWTYDGGAMSTLVELPGPLKGAIAARVGLTGDDLDAYLVEQFEGMGGTDWLWQLLGPEVMDVYRTSHQVSPEYHVRMQAAWQANGRTTNGVSKTINMPNSATIQDISDALMLAWELKCKAVTVYRDGSKETQVLESASGVSAIDRVQVWKATAGEDLKAGDLVTASPERHRLEFNASVVDKFAEEHLRTPGHAPKRPRSLQGETVEVNTGHGPWFFTINRDPNGDVLEVFLTPGDNNSCIKAGATIVGRLLSMALRSGVSLEAVRGQLKGIDCGHGTWEDGKFITSVYDALARVLTPPGQDMEVDGLAEVGREYQDYLRINGRHIEVGKPGPHEPYTIQRQGVLCPDCGQASMFHRGGCLQCVSCGHNTCE